MHLRTCVSPEGRFRYGIHQPHFTADNYRESTSLADLGPLPDGTAYRNRANYPSGPVHAPAAAPIFEIPNAFPFRGTTYIGKAWADARAACLQSIRLPQAPEVSFTGSFSDEAAAKQAIQDLPRPLQLALAVTSTDARDLGCLAHEACRFSMDRSNAVPRGLAYLRRPDGRITADISDEDLFEAVANNRHLPDIYKLAMVLRPGAQGESEIVGEWLTSSSHVFEYLRRNSYIPWGHYAANMADDAVRYRLHDLSVEDMTGMRHLYYQRSYTRLAALLKVPSATSGRLVSEEELESLRQRLLQVLPESSTLAFDRTLWGWNFGFDFAPSGYRLHASHQQIHQQYAMIPTTIPCASDDGSLPAYACGDLVADFVSAYREVTGKSFFDCYQAAIAGNRRMDGNNRRDPRLVVFEDERVMVFVPKAQTSQWELQLMPKSAVGNIFEADMSMRRSLDRGIYKAVLALGALGARMITSIEYSKPIVGGQKDQRLLLAFLPKLPESPGAFSEAQLRWINAHYPEDFALACRSQLPHG
jgi:diadenosine tetraphosphate (Ap4A) HIT family hydrolase